MNKNIIKLIFLVFFLNSTHQLYSQTYSKEPSTAEWIKTSSIGLAAVALKVGLSFVETPTCTWCATNKFDSNISEALIWRNPGAARLTSDILAFGIAPLMVFGSTALVSPSAQIFARNLLIIFDSVAATSALTELSKISFRRARPGVIFGYDSPTNEDTNRSFWSGHTSLTFALLSTASVLAFKNNYPWAPYFAGSSALLGAFVAYARIAGAKHWTSDVLMGMAIGIGVGVAMPFLTLDHDSRVALSASSQGVLLSYVW